MSADIFGIARALSPRWLY